MSNFDYFKHYVEEEKRLRENALRDEENFFHKQHIQEFNEMMDAKIKAMVPQMIQEHEAQQNVNVRAYFNGKPATNENIVKGVREMIADAIRKAWGRGR